MIPGRLAPIECMGLLPGSHCPHYDGEPGRRPAYHGFLREGRLEAGYAADDGAALQFVGRKLERVVSSRATAKAYSVRLVGNDIEEIALETDWLGSAV